MRCVSVLPMSTGPESSGRRDESGEAVATIAPPAEESSVLKLSPGCYHGPAGELVRLIEPHSESDPIAVLVSTLVGFGNLIGPAPAIPMERDQHPARLYAVLVGTTSKSRKGTSWGWVRHVLEAADGYDWAEKCIAGGLSTGEGLIDAVRDPKGDEDPIDRRLLVFMSEFGAVLRHFERPGNILSATLRDLWDRGSARSLVKTSPTRTTGAHVSLLGHITVDELRRLLTGTSMADGFGNRICWFLVRRSKQLPFGGDLDDRLLQPVIDQLRSAVSEARRIGQVTWSRDARDMWREVYSDLSAAKPGLIGAMIARAEAQVLRLSLTYALLDGSPTIEPDHLIAGYAVWDLADKSVRRIFANRTGDPVADRIGELLRAAPGQTLTRNELRDATSRHVESWRMDTAVESLAALDLVEFRFVETGGRPAQAITWTGPA